MGIEDDMNVSLYVGDLHSDVSEVNLLKLFGESNISSCRVVRDVTTKRSRGYAYVNFNSHDAAERAQEKFNQVVFLGKPIRLMWAVKNPEKRRDGRANVFIKNIDKSVDSRTIYEAFKTFGRINSFKICTDDSGHSLGYGFIHFETEEEAEHAIGRVNGIVFKNKAVTLARFMTKKERNVSPKVSFNNVFVKNFTESDIPQVKGIFEAFGKVESSEIKSSGKDSKCFGFFCYSDASLGEKVVSCLDGTQLNSGLKIYVNKAIKKSERAAELKKSREAWRDKMHNETKNRNLYVRNFPDTWKDEDLRAAFAQFGEISSCRVMVDVTGRSKLFGFVCFVSEESAKDALEKKAALKANEKPLFIVLAQTKDERRYTMAKQFSQMKNVTITHQGRAQANQMAVMGPQAMLQNYPPFDIRQAAVAAQNRNLFTPVGMKGPVASYLYPQAPNPQTPAYGRIQAPLPVLPQNMKHGQQKPGEYQQNQRGVAGHMAPQNNYRINAGSQRHGADQFSMLKQCVSGLLKKSAPDSFVTFVDGKLNSAGRTLDTLSDAEVKRMLDDWSHQGNSK